MTLDEYADYADDTAPPSEDKLSLIERLAALQLEQERDILRLEDELKAAKKAFEQTNEIDLPAALNELGLSKCETKEGWKVSLVTGFFPSIKKDDADDFYNWLAATGRDGAVKIAVHAGDLMSLDEARKIRDSIADLGVTSELQRSIHAQTLKALAREMIEANVVLPPSLSIHTVIKAKVTVPKSRTGRDSL